MARRGKCPAASRISALSVPSSGPALWTDHYRRHLGFVPAASAAELAEQMKTLRLGEWAVVIFRRRFALHRASFAPPPSSPRSRSAPTTSRGGVLSERTGLSSTKSMYPIIISSKVWSPQETALVGSGLAGLAEELS